MFRKILLLFAIILFSSFPTSLYSMEYLWEFSILYDGYLLQPYNTPIIYNGSVTYSAGYGSIFYWDGIQTKTILDYGGGHQSSFNGNIAWAMTDSNGEYNIYFWNGLDTVSITQDNNLKGFPSVWENTIAWETPYFYDSHISDIYYFDGQNIRQITDTLGTLYSDVSSSLWDGQIAFTRWSPAGSGIMLWDGADLIEITPLMQKDRYPSLYNGTIAFSRGSGQDSHIMFWDGTTVSEIAQYTSYINGVPRVALWENMIVWSGYDGQYAQIFLWDGTQVHQVTDNNAWHYYPDICIQDNQIQIVYIESDYGPVSLLNRVIYATAIIPEPSQIILSMICIFLLFIKCNETISKQNLNIRR